MALVANGANAAAASVTGVDEVGLGGSRGEGTGEEQGRDMGNGPSALPSLLPASGAGGSCTAWAAAPDLGGCPPGAGGAVSFEKVAPVGRWVAAGSAGGGGGEEGGGLTTSWNH